MACIAREGSGEVLAHHIDVGSLMLCILTVSILYSIALSRWSHISCETWLPALSAPDVFPETSCEHAWHLFEDVNWNCYCIDNIFPVCIISWHDFNVTHGYFSVPKCWRLALFLDRFLLRLNILPITLYLNCFTYLQVNAGQADTRVSLLYYYATDGTAQIEPQIHGQRHLKSLEGFDSELGGFNLAFHSQGNDLSYDHMVSYTPGYEHIQTVMKYGLEMKHANSGEQLPSHIYILLSFMRSAIAFRDPLVPSLLLVISWYRMSDQQNILHFTICMYMYVWVVMRWPSID